MDQMLLYARYLLKFDNPDDWFTPRLLPELKFAKLSI